MDELKHCPFCGSSVEWEYNPFDEITGAGDDGGGMLVCFTCNIGLHYGSLDEAVEHWNQRYTQGN